MYEITFKEPTQVKFYDIEEGWLQGIAYGNVIVCACCGGVFHIATVLEEGKASGEEFPIQVYKYWADFSEFISDEE